MKVMVDTVPLSACRNGQLDDWWADAQGIKAVAAQTGNIDYTLLIAIHALVEARLCQQHGIDETDVAQYDFDHPDSLEPGEEMDCPYRKEHLAAVKAEMFVAEILGVDWLKYTAHLASLETPTL